MTEATAETTFASLGLSEALVQTLGDLGYEAPTPIQARTIPALLAGKDIIGQAQTGTGKTAAFSLPLLQQLDPSQKETQALILAPTRELAMQVAEAMHSYAKRIPGVTILPVYGGAPIVPQMKHLQRGAQIVVGTPGRLIDHLDRKTLDLSHVRFVVLDEADEMLKMGFIEEVERMLSLVATPRQVALFSATMPEAIARIAQKHLVKPERVQLEHRSVAAPAIEQRFLNISEGQKLDVLTQILELESAEAVLVFRRTKNGAAELAEKLSARGYAAEPMHGDMTQAMRESVIRRLRNGQIELVVATDVAARGLDVEQITHVINYDVPHDVEAYVHRIGRTGRAGRTGLATLFITPRERRMMREIERFTGTQIKPMKMPTRADVAARRISVFKEALRKNVEDGDLDLYVELVTQLSEEGGLEMAEIAAAAARIANGSRSLAMPSERENVYEAAPATPARTERPRASRSDVPYAPRESSRPDAGYAPRETSRPPRPPAEDEAPRAEGQSEPKVRLSMAVGKVDGIRPADIVGSIANEADVPGRDIGPIDIRDEVTYVVIPEKYCDQVLDKVGRAKFRGRPVNIQIATGSEPPPRGPEDRPARRSDREERPRPSGDRPTGPRKYTPSGDAPRRPYGAGERPTRPTASRPPYGKPDRYASEGPKRAYKPAGERPGGYSRAGGDRPQGAGYRGAGAARPQGGSAYRPTADRAVRPTAKRAGSYERPAESARPSRAPAAKAPFYGALVKKKKYDDGDKAPPKKKPRK